MHLQYNRMKGAITQEIVPMDKIRAASSEQIFDEILVLYILVMRNEYDI